jgi:hypothetical protein
MHEQTDLWQGAGDVKVKEGPNQYMDPLVQIFQRGSKYFSSILTPSLNTMKCMDPQSKYYEVYGPGGPF